MYEQETYGFLRKTGMTKDGALGVMGNLKAESGLYPCRLEGDYRAGFDASRLYADKVDSGEISRYTFAHDGKGWGIYQLTYWTRKEGFYDYCKEHGVSIANLDAQLDYLVLELKRDYSGLWTYLCATSDMYTVTARFCREFERPAYNNIDTRYQFAKNLEQQVSDGGYDKPHSDFWPPRMIDRNMSGPDVEVLQAILKARGYAINYISGKFDDLLTKQVKQFQSDNHLISDGVCGPKTWAAIVKL